MSATESTTHESVEPVTEATEVTETVVETVPADSADESVAGDASATEDASAAEAVPAAEEAAVAEDGAADDAPAADQATDAAPAPAAVPTPGPRPTPSPAAMRPRPQAPAAAAASAVEEASAGAEEWGRVTDDGTVSVREGDEWREVGQYPDGTPAEALAYFRRKYDDIDVKVRNLEQRHAGGGAAASELTGQARHLITEATGAAAVGDLRGLVARLESLVAQLSEASAEEAKAQREAVAAAVVERTAIVEKAEALAARDPQTVQWKQASAELNDLFAAWQAHQTDGPRLGKAVSQELWKRFRNARSTVERHRREFFAKLDETHKSARDAKTRLVEKAEALVPRGEDGIPSYRTLLDEWKRSGRAGRKADDALWARFKAAGDALYGARTERDAAEQAESAPRIEERKALLVEAAAVADEGDLRKARQILTDIQRRWDEVGRIFPRDKERALDDDMRKIEQALRAREDVDWKKNNPETKARATGMAAQLLDAIAKLEDDLAAAEKAGDARATAEARDALEARRAWLKAVGG